MKKPVDPYQEFREFFEDHLKGAKREQLTGRLMLKQAGHWEIVNNQIKTLKSFARSNGLPHDQTDIHLSRYIHEKPKELLFEPAEWDGKDRINELKDVIKFKALDFQVFEEIIKQWGANVFKRIEDPSNQNICPIFKGDQGLGKDFLIEKLTKGFGMYYSKLTNAKDEVEIWRQVSSKIIMHIPEFDQTSKVSIPFLKDIITRDYVELRSLYEQHYETRPCHVSYISSANIDAILRDTTGNRRFMVFDIESIKRQEYPKDYSSQIFAQFNELYKLSYQASEDAIKLASNAMEQFKPENIEDMIIEFWDERVSKMLVAKNTKELGFEDAQHVIMDITRLYGWRPQTVSYLLRKNFRKRESNGKTLYTAPH